MHTPNQWCNFASVMTTGLDYCKHCNETRQAHMLLLLLLPVVHHGVGNVAAQQLLHAALLPALPNPTELYRLLTLISKSLRRGDGDLVIVSSSTTLGYVRRHRPGLGYMQS
jgi:hypothetical protein